NRLLLTLAMAGVVTASNGQASNASPYDFDVAGLKIGEAWNDNVYKEKLEQINVGFEFTRIVNKQDETKGFGAQQKFKDSKLAYQLSSQYKDRMFVYAGDDQKVQQIIRLQVLPPDEQITLGQLRSALVEKYGEPTEEGRFGAMAMS